MSLIARTPWIGRRESRCQVTFVSAQRKLCQSIARPKLKHKTRIRQQYLCLALFIRLSSRRLRFLLVIDRNSNSIAERHQQNQPSCTRNCPSIADVEVDETGYGRLNLPVGEGRWPWSRCHCQRRKWHSAHYRMSHGSLVFSRKSACDPA